MTPRRSRVQGTFPFCSPKYISAASNTVFLVLFPFIPCHKASRHPLLFGSVQLWPGAESRRLSGSRFESSSVSLFSSFTGAPWDTEYRGKEAYPEVCVTKTVRLRGQERREGPQQSCSGREFSSLPYPRSDTVHASQDARHRGTQRHTSQNGARSPGFRDPMIHPLCCSRLLSQRWPLG